MLLYVDIGARPSKRTAGCSNNPDFRKTAVAKVAMPRQRSQVGMPVSTVVGRGEHVRRLRVATRFKRFREPHDRLGHQSLNCCGRGDLQPRRDLGVTQPVDVAPRDEKPTRLLSRHKRARPGRGRAFQWEGPCVSDENYP